MSLLRRLAALVLALCVFSCAAAGASGLGSLLQSYIDVNTDVRLSAGVELQTVMPFNDDGLALLGGVLKHMTLDASIITREDGGELSFGISVDGDSAFSLTQREDAQGFTLETTLLPNRTLEGDRDITDALFGKGTDEPVFDALTAVSEVEGIYKELTDGIMEYAEEKRANYKIKSIGTAKWSRIARLTAEQGAELAPKLTAVLSCGLDAEYRERLTGLACQKGFTVGLYRTAEDGKDIAVYMKGNVTLADGEAYALSYQWAFADEGTERKDTYKLELTKKKSPSDNILIASSYTQKIMSDRFSLSGKCDVTRKIPKLTTLTTVRHDLEGMKKGDSRTFEGTVSEAVKTTVDGKAETVTATVTPKLTLTSAEGSGALSGTVGYEKLKGKTKLTELKLTFDDDAAGKLSSDAKTGELYAVDDDDVVVSIIDPVTGLAMDAPTQQPVGGDNGEAAGANDYSVGGAPIGLGEYEVPAQPQTIDISKASGEQLQALADEMAQRLAGELLIRLARLPAEDAALLSDGMSEEDYQAFISLLSGR